MNNENIIENSYWLEFTDNDKNYINIKKSEIEYVKSNNEIEELKDYTEIGLKSGYKVLTRMSYEKVMELV